MPVSENMTQSEIWRLVDVNEVKCIHFGHVEIFSSTRLLISLVEYRPFTTMSEVKVNQWDQLSEFLFHKRRFTDPIATNGALLEGFMFAIGWPKCSTNNEQFGLYGSLGKIENAKDECQKRGANISSVGCILGQSLQYFGDSLFQEIQNCYKSLGVQSFDKVNCEANIPSNQHAFKFALAISLTMNGFKSSPHLDKDALLYALGWWFQADKRTGQIQRDVSKRCTGRKLIFPNEHFWIDLSECHGLIQASDNSHANPYACEGSQQFKQFLTPVLASNNSHANPYAFEGSQQFKQFLTPVQASNNSYANPSACEHSRQLKQFNT
ncbi:hypothetical protein O181_059908 [Austropuccinia psidii MF-1]|uniref:Tet-like 2OG-Fe(II) oxygenase domain-containing protein n=1 Tax=Austropuccinia psidii MF-1 TaxID=1389203 RepID=A0A9Q3HWZ6_9BASI|nr:hypothetical protein [Austropuccinia psidii MF-1]